MRSCRASAESDDAAAWVQRWKHGKANTSEAAGNAAAAAVPRAAAPKAKAGNAYTYAFVHDALAGPDSFTALFLRDALARRGVTLHVPHLAGDDGVYTVSGAKQKLAAWLDAEQAQAQNNSKVRLVGFGFGAVAAAEIAQHNRGSIDSLLLLSPRFDAAAAVGRLAGSEDGLKGWEEAGALDVDGVQLGWEFAADCLAREGETPFVYCQAYVVHGWHDEIAPLDDSVNWTRNASVHMRKRGMPEDVVPERRLVEVDDDASLLASFKTIVPRLLDWYQLIGEEDFQAAASRLEGTTQADFARGHEYNFEVYKNYIESLGLTMEDIED